VTAVGGTTDPASCSDGSPPLVNDGTSTTCSGDFAETTFRWALCSCTDVVLTNPMTTDAFSSAAGSYMPGGLGGGVGLNGAYDASSEVTAYGDLWASSADGLESTNPTDIKQEVHVGGTVQSSGTFAVGEDAYIAGNLETDQPFTITGDLYIPAGAEVSPSPDPVSYASRIDQDVVVGPPCDCEADDKVPVAGIVTWGQANNDNAALSLDADVLSAPGVDTRVDLPCGNYYLSEIDVANPTVIWAHGRVNLFIGGDITSTSPFLITLDPDAELNIFVAGTVDSSNPLTIGSVLYPALTRLYVGGSAEITLSNPTSIGGYFYAAEGLVNVQNPLEVFGGVIAGDYNADNPVDIHYDREVLSAGKDCPDDGDDDCDSCLDCNGQACNGGTCGACTTDADCCAPLRCNNGVCESGFIVQ
jgi:hypothetical protein